MDIPISPLASATPRLATFAPTFSARSAAKVVALVGGTGFLGRHLVHRLVAEGYTLRILARRAPEALHLRAMGALGQVSLLAADLSKPASLAPLLQGVDAVVNLVGILHERGDQQFAALHAQGAEQLAKLSRQAGVRQFVHLSALGTDKATGAKYIRTKSTGEKAVRSAFPEAVILRPGIVFGPEDMFFNQFGRMAALSPVLPLLGGGATKFQPVYVGDVAAAVAASLRDSSAQGQTYELGGPEVLTFRELMQRVCQWTNRTPCLVKLPNELAYPLAMMTEWLPNPPITRDQLRMLRADNVVGETALTFRDLGITPTTLDSVVPSYLARFRPRGAQA